MALLYSTQQPAASLRAIAQAIELCTPWDQQPIRNELGYFMVRQGMLIALTGDLETARTLLENALTDLSDSPSGAQISARLSLGRIYLMQGNPSAAEMCWRAAVTAAEAIGDTSRLVRIWRNLAMLADERGELTIALERSRRALTLAQQIGDRVSEGHITSNLAFTHLRLQQTGAATQLLAAADAIAAQLQDTDLACHLLVNRARLNLLRGQFDAAADRLTTALSRCAHADHAELLSEIYALYAQLALRQNLLDDALTYAQHALAAAADSPLDSGIAMRIQGEVYSALGEEAVAEALINQSIESLAPYPYDQAQSICTLARHLKHAGATARAEQLLRSVQTIYTTLHLDIASGSELFAW